MLNSARELLDRRLSTIPAAFDLHVGNTLLASPSRVFFLRYFEVVTSALSREFPVIYELMNGIVGFDGALSNVFAFRIPYLQARGMLEVISAVQKRSAVS